VKAVVTDKVGIAYDVALEFDRVREDGTVVLVGTMPVPVEDVHHVTLDVLPVRTGVEFRWPTPQNTTRVQASLSVGGQPAGEWRRRITTETVDRLRHTMRRLGIVRSVLAVIVGAALGSAFIELLYGRWALGLIQIAIAAVALLTRRRVVAAQLRCLELLGG
jgi:hypothetical protein